MDNQQPLNPGNQPQFVDPTVGAAQAQMLNGQPPVAPPQPVSQVPAQPQSMGAGVMPSQPQMAPGAPMQQPAPMPLAGQPQPMAAQQVMSAADQQLPASYPQPQFANQGMQAPPQPGAVPVGMVQTQPMAQQPFNPAMTNQPMTGANPGKVLNAMHSHERPVSMFVVVLVAVLSVANIAFAAHVLGVRSKNYNLLPEVKAANAQKNFGADIQDRTDGTLDMSKKINRRAAKPQDIKAKLNQQINFSNGFSMMVTGVDENWAPRKDSYASKPRSGNRLVLLKMVIGNRSDTSQPLLMSDVSAEVNGKVYKEIRYYASSNYFSDESTEVFGSLGSGDFESGESRNGVFVVEVPKGTISNITINQDVYYTKYTDEGGKLDIATAKAEIAL